MQFGICTTLDQASIAKSSGWDFVEESVQGLLQGEIADEAWQGLQRAQASALPVPSANMLVPGSLKITGPDADLQKLREYMTRVLARAEKIKMHTLVFGSGGARNVPAGFDRGDAWDQIAEFAQMSADLANQHKITIVLEPLNRTECNIVNSVKEAMVYVKAVNHPNFQCLVDSYHFWLEDEPMENLAEAMPNIRHVHLADKVGRVAPGGSGQSDYIPFFRTLKQGGYDGLIGVEAIGFTEVDFGRVLKFLKDQWKSS